VLFLDETAEHTLFQRVEVQVMQHI
jgi:hypothetical protein